MRIGAKLALLAAIAVLILAVCGALLYVQYAVSVADAKELASRIFAERARSADGEINALLDRAIALDSAALTEKGVGAPVSGDGRGHPALDFLFAAVRSAPSIYAAYYGLADGSFLEAIATHGNPDIIKALGAPAGTDHVIRTVTVESGQETAQNWTFLDAAGAVLGARTDANPTFDPRKTRWYQAGSGGGGPVLTRPYQFSSAPVVGVTAVQGLPANHGVFGVDFTLGDLSRLIAERPISPNGSLYIFDNSLVLLAAPPDGPNGVPTDRLMSDMRTLRLPVLQALAELSQSANIGQSTLIQVQGRDYMALVSRWRGKAAPMVDIGIIAPLDDFTGPIKPLIIRTSIMAFALLAAAALLVAWFARKPGTRQVH